MENCSNSLGAVYYFYVGKKGCKLFLTISGKRINKVNAATAAAPIMVVLRFDVLLISPLFIVLSGFDYSEYLYLL